VQLRACSRTTATYGGGTHARHCSRARVSPPPPSSRPSPTSRLARPAFLIPPSPPHYKYGRARGEDRNIEAVRSARISPRGVGKLCKITDKYSRSNERRRGRRRLDLAILIVARRARRRAAAAPLRSLIFLRLPFSSRSCTDLLLFPSTRSSPRARARAYAHRVELSRDNLRGMMPRVRVDSESNLLRIYLKSRPMIRSCEEHERSSRYQRRLPAMTLIPTADSGS
jgi:hypothetical protein